MSTPKPDGLTDLERRFEVAPNEAEQAHTDRLRAEELFGIYAVETIVGASDARLAIVKLIKQHQIVVDCTRREGDTHLVAHDLILECDRERAQKMEQNAKILMKRRKVRCVR